MSCQPLLVKRQCRCQAVVHREPCAMRQRPPKYDGKSIWESFRAQFEIVAELNEWTSAEMAAFLATSLEGSAANVITSIETSKRRDHAALVDFQAYICLS